MKVKDGYLGYEALGLPSKEVSKTTRIFSESYTSLLGLNGRRGWRDIKDFHCFEGQFRVHWGPDFSEYPEITFDHTYSGPVFLLDNLKDRTYKFTCQRHYEEIVLPYQGDYWRKVW